MNRFARTVLAVSFLVVPLAACSDFDPTSLFDGDIFNPKKPLPGERKALFPEGTPGVPQGVPPDLYKGYQPPVAQVSQDVGPDSAGPVSRGRSPDAPEEQPKPKPKPKPKVAAAPPAQPRPTPTSITVQPGPPPQSAAPPPSAFPWPDAVPPSGQPTTGR